MLTGLGLVTPLGTGLQKNWDAVTAGLSGIKTIDRFPNVETYPSRIAGQVTDFRAEDFIEAKEIKKMDRFIHFAMGAAAMAMEDSGLRSIRSSPKLSAS